MCTLKYYWTSKWFILAERHLTSYKNSVLNFKVYNNSVWPAIILFLSYKLNGMTRNVDAFLKYLASCPQWFYYYIHYYINYIP